MCFFILLQDTYIDAFLSKKRTTNTEESAPKRLCRLNQQKFGFAKHCLFCGQECASKDSKHPDR